MALQIETKIIFSQSAEQEAYFHPKVCVEAHSGELLMTLQTLRGSDFYGPPLCSRSDDLGESWSEPSPISSLGIHPYEDERIFEGVCDVVPDYHSKSGKTLAIGHNVFT